MTRERFNGSLDRSIAASVENYYAGRFEEEQCGCGAVLDGRDGREAQEGLCRKCQEEE